MLADWTIYQTPQMLLVTILAVGLIGLSKGGLGGAFALAGVPIMSLAMPPLLAAAVLLPILLIMDAISLANWWRYRDWSLLRTLLPAALLGVGAGWSLAAVTSDTAVRLIVGIVALSFALRALLGGLLGRSPRHRPWMGWLWGALSGFTSFVAHAGGPPFQVHVLPKKLDPKLYTGTSVTFFAVVNAAKVLPYASLGMFEPAVLYSVLVVIPVAALCVSAGAWIVRRLSPQVFYPLSYTMIALFGVKLIWDGLAGL